ncbi:SpoIID/LytB domain-containing protein [bacterium]|nr:SpoIID/LytB domain-containing protein [bacterium]
MILRISFSVVFFFLFVTLSYAKSSEIRVRVQKNLKSFEISGLDLSKKSYSKDSEHFYPGEKSIRFHCTSKSSKAFQGSKRLFSLSSPSGMITINNTRYFGRVDVISAQNKRACDLVNIVSIEKYISTLLAHEMNASWPLSALKAQAVAARSYALYKIKSRQVSRSLGKEAYYDLESSEKHQVSGNLSSVTQRTSRAARETSGEVLVDQVGRLKPIFFHARCGGQTFKPRDIWGNSVGAYSRVKCSSCKKSHKGHWKYYLTSNQLHKFISWATKRSFIKKETIRIAEDEINRKFVRIYHGTEVFEVKKIKFRRYFGRVKFSSNLFKLKPYLSGLVVTGKGLGHGVGLCQIGALNLAHSGSRYKKILKHYYPLFKVSRKYL